MSDVGRHQSGWLSRSERVERAILAATLNLLGSRHSVSELSIEGIAAAAEVGKSTIYRRWANKEQLIADALATLQVPMPDLPGTSVRDDLIGCVDALRETNHSQAIFPSLVSEMQRYPEFLRNYDDRVVEPRRRVARAVLERGVKNGELRSDLDIALAIELLSGPMLTIVMLRPCDGEIDPNTAERIVDLLIGGFAPPSADLSTRVTAEQRKVVRLNGNQPVQTGTEG